MVIVAPVAGRVIAMADVPDPVFASGMLGKGCGVWPSGSVVRAPAAGVVSVAMSHAVAISCDGGVELSCTWASTRSRWAARASSSS